MSAIKPSEISDILKNNLENVSLKLETNILENLFDLSLWTRNAEVLLTNA